MTIYARGNMKDRKSPSHGHRYAWFRGSSMSCIGRSFLILEFSG